MSISIGSIPPYDLCSGCKIDAAYGCIDDMRRNVSGTVPMGCKMNGLTETPQSICCPLFADSSSTHYKMGTYAYVQALKCLRSVGCQQSVYYTELVSECASVCLANGIDGIDMDKIQWRCTALKSAALTNLSSNNLMMYFVFVSISIILCFS